MVNKQKAGVRLCLVHLLAVNLCVWAVTVITGTVHHYRHLTFALLSSSASHPGNTTTSHLKSCYGELTLARTAAPYLFPCTVIYSIIAAGVIYRIYTNVGVQIRKRWPSHASFTSSVAPQGMVLVDCEKAHRGLFSGLLVAVGTLIAIATFFVLDTRLNRPMTAIKVFFILEISLLLLTGLGLVTGVRQFQKLRFLKTPMGSTSSLDALLLLLSLGGVYLYLGFRLVSSASSLDEHPLMSLLSVLSLILELLQTTLQVIFVVDGFCRRALNDLQVEQKPGRAAVTFVLVCNLAQWLLTLFETRRAKVLPLHQEFYGDLPWTVLLHLCVPLYIYFRFHSAICLSKIWYHAYTKGD